MDLVIDYSGDLLLYLTDDGKSSPAAAAQNERIAASVSASPQAAGVTLPPAATPNRRRAPPPRMLGTQPRAPRQASTRSADPINLRAMSTTDTTNAICVSCPKSSCSSTLPTPPTRMYWSPPAVSARHKLNSLANLREVHSSLAFSIPTGYSSGTWRGFFA